MSRLWATDASEVREKNDKIVKRQSERNDGCCIRERNDIKLVEGGEGIYGRVCPNLFFLRVIPDIQTKIQTEAAA